MIDLSIVLPTCNRAELLRDAIAAIARTTRSAFEIIVVDGASTDHTREVVSEAQETFGGQVRAIFEPAREGFVRAVNKGFRAARGRCLTWLNDDARPADGALDAAVDQIDRAYDLGRNVAFVAMFHHWKSMKNIAYETTQNGTTYRLCHVRGTLYANFPVGRRETFEHLDYFDERFFVCAADPDLSLKAWAAGMAIEPAYGAIIDHDECEDERRVIDSPRANRDNLALFAKWNLPPRNTWRNEFDPANPCTLAIPGMASTRAA